MIYLFTITVELYTKKHIFRTEKDSFKVDIVSYPRQNSSGNVLIFSPQCTSRVFQKNGRETKPL